MKIATSRFFWVLITLSTLTVPGNASVPPRSPISPDVLPADGSFAAKNNILILGEGSSPLALNQVLQNKAAFWPATENIPQFGKDMPPHWLWATLKNTSGHEQELVAEVDYPYLKSVVFYVTDSLGKLIVKSEVQGWPNHRARSGFPSRNPQIRFRAAQGVTYWLFVRAHSGPYRLSVPLRVWKARQFDEQDRSEQLLWGWINGMFTFIIFLGVLLAFLLRDRLYGYYALYALFSWLFLLSFEGLLLEWIDWQKVKFVTVIDFQYFNTFMQVLLNTLFLRGYILPALITHRWVGRVYLHCIALTLFNISFVFLNGLFPGALDPYSFLIGPTISFNYITTIALNTSLILWVASGSRERFGSYRQSSRLYLLSTAPLLVVVLASLLRNYTLIPDHPLFQTQGLAIAMLSEFIILSIGLGYRYKRILDERHLLSEENHRHQQEAIENQLRLQQQEVKALEAQIRLQQEKERIARDLHDHVGSQLSVIANSLDYPLPTESPSTQRIHSVSNYARCAIQSLRDTIWAIHQEKLTPVEFRIKLQQLIQQQQELIEGCVIHLSTDFRATTYLSSGQALNLYRITQEALNNALKYAKASQIVVKCQITPQQLLTLSVEDNGVGFVSHSTDDQPRYGLINMQHRAQELGGECCIESRPGQGTSIRIDVPLLTQNTPTVV